MQLVELHEVREQLSELLNQALSGQEIIITENTQPLLRLTRITVPKPKRTLGTAAGDVWMAPDFNDSYEEWIEEWEKETP